MDSGASGAEKTIYLWEMLPIRISVRRGEHSYQGCCSCCASNRQAYRFCRLSLLIDPGACDELSSRSAAQRLVRASRTDSPLRVSRRLALILSIDERGRYLFAGCTDKYGLLSRLLSAILMINRHKGKIFSRILDGSGADIQQSPCALD